MRPTSRSASWGGENLPGEHRLSFRELHLLARGWFCLRQGHGDPDASRSASGGPGRPAGGGRVAPARRALLVPAPGLAHRLPAPDRGACVRAVDVAAVAGAADAHLPCRSARRGTGGSCPGLRPPTPKGWTGPPSRATLAPGFTCMSCSRADDPAGGPARLGLDLHFLLRPQRSTAPAKPAKQAHEIGTPGDGLHARSGDNGASAGDGSAVFRTPHEHLPEHSQIHVGSDSHSHTGGGSTFLRGHGVLFARFGGLHDRGPD